MIVYGVHDSVGMASYYPSKTLAFADARRISRKNPDYLEVNETAEVTRDVVTTINKALICRLLSGLDGTLATGWCESSKRIAEFRNGRKVRDLNEVIF